MGTTISPLMNGGPGDDESPLFPATAGRGMGYEELVRLQESNHRKKSSKQIIKEAEGVLNPKHTRAKVKKAAKPKNLRASDPKKGRKAGAFGEAYKAPSGAKGKGVRVAESMSGIAGNKTVEALLRNPAKFGKVVRAYKESRFFAEAGRFREKAPAGWEGTVKHMKKHKDIDNPWALAHYMKNEGYTPHH